MEVGEELRLILAYLSVVAHSSSLFWPSQVVEGLKALSSRPNHSRVDSSEVFFLAISDLRQSLSSSSSSSSNRLASSAAHDYCVFFDDSMSHVEAAKWFAVIVPIMANLLLRLPSLLEAHYKDVDE